MSLRYVILTHLNEKPHTGYSVTKAINHSHYWGTVIQQTYKEIKVLQKEAWIEEQLDSGTRGNAFTITEQGRQALITWLSTPVTTSEPRDTLCVKLINHQLAPVELSKELERSIKSAHKTSQQYETLLTSPHLTIPQTLVLKKRLAEVQLNLDWYTEIQETLF
ncbi:PadR family transcriptional regulator [Vibrio sp. 10N.247.311.51]|uniref:PadR family transcriptional regulator n=1 Tax=Vibrio sp. 10N.247.311.51 TaxID=3229996 RepID=UPI003554526A